MCKNHTRKFHVQKPFYNYSLDAQNSDINDIMSHIASVYTLEILFKILSMEIVWILVENTWNSNFHILIAIYIYYGYRHIVWYGYTMV
jgi:hypothetical protein